MIDQAAPVVDRWRGLAVGEWAVVGAAGLLLVSLMAFDWFALSVANQVAPDSGGNAFERLDGLDHLIVIAAVVAIAGPLARALGILRVPGRYVAAVTGAAGLLATLFITYAIVSPPDVDPSMLGPYAGGLDAGLEPRGGAFVGLALAAGVVAGSVLTIMRAPGARTTPPLQPLAAPAHHGSVPPQQVRTVEPTPAATEPKRAPKAKAKPTAEKGAAKPKRTPKPPPRKRAAKPQSKSAARKGAAKPKAKPAARKRTPKPKTAPAGARTRLATATFDDLIAVGFTPTQAKRIVSYRDEQALVTKVSDLKRVPGIAKPVLAELVKRLED